MSDEKRYAAFGENFDFHKTPRGARAGWTGINPCHIYEIGLEVKEPDYGPLVEWLRAAHEAEKTYLLHRPECECGIKSDDCICGFTDALKAAQIG